MNDVTTFPAHEPRREAPVPRNWAVPVGGGWDRVEFWRFGNGEILGCDLVSGVGACPGEIR